MPRITPARLDRLFEINAELAKTKKEMRSLETEAKQIFTDAEADLRETDRDQAKRGEYLLVWKVKRAAVAWAQEFIRECGADKANALKAATPETKSLDIVHQPKPV